MARSKPPKQSFAKDTQTAAAEQNTLSAFHPTLPLYANAILSLDAWHIRVLDPTTSQQRHEYVLDKGLTCRCLAWGQMDKVTEKSKKKRKVEEGGQVGLLAAGLSDGSIQLFSTAREGILRTIKGAHTGPVTGLAIAGDRLWSVGEDGLAFEYSASTGQMHNKVTVDASQALRSVAIQPSADEAIASVLVASYSIQVLDYPSGNKSIAYTNHTSPVHSIAFAGPTQIVSAAEEDRYMNLFTIGQTSQDRSFVAEADVTRIAVGANTLCAATSEGAVALFDLKPVGNGAVSSGKRRKSIVSSATSKLCVKRQDGKAVHILDLSVRPDGTLLLVWLEGARVVFERVVLRDAAQQLVTSTELVRAPQPAMGAHAADKAVEQGARPYHEGQARIGTSNETGDLDMAEAFDEAQASEADQEEEDEEEEEDAEPTLQERLHALEVSGATPSKQKSTSKQVLQMPSAGSLTTVLTQALKSSDTALLESCLHQSDSKIILATVRRLDPVLSVALLEQLASRLSRRPGRAGDLGVWVRWTVVVHGGYLSSLPNLVKTLASLHATLSNRAATLPRLLALQGRLDMVQAQIELRREGGARQQLQEEASDVEYNENESDISDEEEIEMEDAEAGDGFDSNDEDSDEGSDEEDEGEFSDESEEGDAFAQLDADMEAHTAVDEVESEELEQSDDDAEA